MYHLTEAVNRLKIDLTALAMGDDLCVIIVGGSKPHLGATALAVPRPSLADPVKISSSASVLTVVGHKEDELARKAALILSAQLQTNVVVCCGIHEDSLRPEEIAEVNLVTERLIQQLVTKVKQNKKQD